MNHKVFHLKENDLDVTINQNEIVMKWIDTKTKDVLLKKIFDSKGVFSNQVMREWLDELMTPYETDIVVQTIHQYVIFSPSW